MEDNLNQGSQDDVVAYGRTSSFEEELQAASNKFEEELQAANENSTSPITDLKSSKEKEKLLRAEIAKILKEKASKINTEEEEEKDKEDLPDLDDDKEKAEEEKEPTIDDGDELIVEAEKGKEDGDEKEDTDKAYDPREYLRRLEEVHNKKMQIYSKQIEQHKLNPDENMLYKALLMERALLDERVNYSDEDKARFDAVSEKYKKEEMAKQKIVRDELKLKVRDFDKMVTELKEANEEIAYVEKLQLQSTERDTGKITEEDAKKRLQIANEKRTKILAEISVTNPELLVEENEKKHEIARTKRTILGAENVEIARENLSAEMKKNIKYAGSVDSKTESTLKLNDDYYQNELKKSKDAYEYQLHKLEQRLRELPEEPVTADDMKEKANVLAQMKQIKSQITAAEDIEKSMQNGMEKNEDRTEKILNSNEEYNVKMDEVEGSFEKTKEYVDRIKYKEGDEAIEHPANSSEENKKAVVMEAAMMGAVIADEGHELHAAAGCAFIASELVRDVNDPEDAKAYLETYDKSEQRDEAIKEQQKVEDEVIG